MDFWMIAGKYGPREYVATPLQCVALPDRSSSFRRIFHLCCAIAQLQGQPDGTFHHRQVRLFCHRFNYSNDYKQLLIYNGGKYRFTAAYCVPRKYYLHNCIIALLTNESHCFLWIPMTIPQFHLAVLNVTKQSKLLCKIYQTIDNIIYK